MCWTCHSDVPDSHSLAMCYTLPGTVTSSWLEPLSDSSQSAVATHVPALPGHRLLLRGAPVR